MALNHRRGMGDQDVLTTEEAVAYLGVTRQTLYNMVNRGELTPLVPEGEWTVKPPALYYRREELDTIQQRRWEALASRLVPYTTPKRRAILARQKTPRPSGSVA